MTHLNQHTWLPRRVRKGLQLSPLSLSSLTPGCASRDKPSQSPANGYKELGRAQPMAVKSCEEPSQWLWRAVKSPANGREEPKPIGCQTQLSPIFKYQGSVVRTVSEAASRSVPPPTIEVSQVRPQMLWMGAKPSLYTLSEFLTHWICEHSKITVVLCH